MRFTVTHPLVSHPCHPDLASGPGVARLAVAAEQAGFDGIGFTDHPAPPQRWLDAGGHDAFDPLVALAFCAAVTERIRLITTILVLPYRNPFLVAKASATVDVLSGGRLTLAVGAGYLRGEFASLGVDVDERNELFDEGLRVLRQAWTSDEVAFEGRHFHAREVTSHPPPVSRPHPPIWIGGNSGRARQRVAEAGDGWMPFPAPAGLARTARTAVLETVDDLAVLMDDLHTRMDNAGRDPSTIDVVFSCSAGGNPASERFDADEHAAGLAALDAIGVTWVNVGLPGDDLGRAIATLDRYGEQVIRR